MLANNTLNEACGKIDAITPLPSIKVMLGMSRVKEVDEKFQHHLQIKIKPLHWQHPMAFQLIAMIMLHDNRTNRIDWKWKEERRRENRQERERDERARENGGSLSISQKHITFSP